MINRQHIQIYPLKIKLILSNLLFVLFLLLAIIALINPKWGMGYAPAEFRRGLDIIFAIDVSRSMDIRDAPVQSRLERGLLIAKQSITSVPGPRYAAAIGRGRGYLAVPLTWDNEATMIFLESIDGSSMTGRSTNIEALVEAAAEAFQNTSPARRVIVLISDGESHAGILRNAINRCIRENIMIVAVAVGSDEGRQILSQADDPSSALVTSRREAAVMRSIAERTGGIYIDGNRDDAGRELSSFLLSITQDMESGSGKKEPIQRRSLFAVLSLIVYAASKFVTRQAKSQPSKLFVSILVLSVFFSSCSEGKLLLLEANYLNSRGRFDAALIPYIRALNHEDAAPYAEYGLGLTFYLLDQGEAALQRYNDSRRLLESFPENEHRELRYRNHYNTGVIFFEKGDYHSAITAFRDALRIDPGRIEAKRNLELSILSISIESGANNRTEEQQEQREILFEYLRQEEQQLWRSREWTAEEEHSGPDY